MSSFFSNTKYRDCLSHLIQRAQGLDAGLSQRELARRIRVQPAYFSNVLKGRANFSVDQVHDLLDQLSVSEVEREYAMLLTEFERSHSASRKKSLREKAQALRARELETHAQIEIPRSELRSAPDEGMLRFYSSPVAQLVHMALCVPAYQQEPRKLIEIFRLSQGELEQNLRMLSELELIELLPGGKVAMKEMRFHLPEDSPLATTHQSLMRLASMEKLRALAPGKKRSVVVTFSTDPATAKRIEETILELLSRTRKWVEQAPSKHVYQLNLDFFRWD